jgi:hypothetical protein
MRKKGVLVLLILGLLLLMGCDNEAGRAITPLEVHGICDTWGQNTETEPEIYISIEDSKLDSIDISMDNGFLKVYPVTVSSTNQNTITGTYENYDPEQDPNTYPIKITLFYNPPKLTVHITGEGPLAGKKYVVEPKL